MLISKKNYLYTKRNGLVELNNLMEKWMHFLVKSTRILIDILVKIRILVEFY